MTKAYSQKEGGAGRRIWSLPHGDWYGAQYVSVSRALDFQMRDVTVKSVHILKLKKFQNEIFLAPSTFDKALSTSWCITKQVSIKRAPVKIYRTKARDRGNDQCQSPESGRIHWKTLFSTTFFFFFFLVYRELIFDVRKNVYFVLDRKIYSLRIIYLHLKFV